VRQYFIRQFLECRIKVLANYLVLATGFVISRPVFSPVRYMQMVGRGLRGPKNGGTETCKTSLSWTTCWNMGTGSRTTILSSIIPRVALTLGEFHRTIRRRYS
jgi:hypothetical protein